MNFSPNKHIIARGFTYNAANIITAVCIVYTLNTAIGIVPHAVAQITISPQVESEAKQAAKPQSTPSTNEYAGKYKEAPFLPARSQKWYNEPKDVASRIPLGDIGIRVRWLPDDAPYMEKIINGIPNRVFLKETLGRGYRIYDLRAVPYGKAPDVPEVKTENAKQETPDSSEQSSQTKQDSETKPIDPFTIYTKIPPSSSRRLGASYLVEITRFKKNQQLDRLARYIQKKLFLSETYRYTTKGALRTLTRRYADTSLSRFTYFFTGGGLEEECHQRADKSVYYKKYTAGGGLKETAEFDPDGTMAYKHAFVFDSETNLVASEEIITFDERVESIYQDGRVFKTVRYSRKKNEDGIIDEKIIDTTRHGYNTAGRGVEDITLGLLSEQRTESEYDDEGTLIKQREFVDSRLVKEIQYKQDNTRVEIQFFENKPVLRVYYKGRAKIKEEPIR